MLERRSSAGGPEPWSDRPEMPAGYEMRDPADRTGLLPWHHAVERLAAARNYWVATTRPDGRPHAMPVWGVWLDGGLLFSSDPTSRKGRNLAANPALAAHLESGDDVVVVEGVGTTVTDPALLARFVDAYEAKYRFRPTPADPRQAVYALRPRVAHAWLESDFQRTATRWRFAQT